MFVGLNIVGKLLQPGFNGRDLAGRNSAPSLRRNDDVPYQVAPLPQFFHAVWTVFKTRLQCRNTCDQDFDIVSDCGGSL